MKSPWLVLAAIIGVFLFSSTPPAQADDASHLQAARDLLLAMHVDQSYATMVDQVLNAQLKEHPELLQMRDPMKQFLNKYMGWDAMKDDLATIYANTFTEDELKQITAFYNTPAGSKLAASASQLTTQGIQLGQQRVADHIEELRELIRKGMADKNPSPETAAPSPAPEPAPPAGN